MDFLRKYIINPRDGEQRKWSMPFITIFLAYLLVELFGWLFLAAEGQEPWPLHFGILWACILTGIVRILPRMPGRIFFGVTYFAVTVYTVVETGYYILFREMMWISEFKYASEGSEFFNVLLQYPWSWWLSLVGLLALGTVILWRFPTRLFRWPANVLAAIVVVLAMNSLSVLPELAFVRDGEIKYAASDYGRAQSAEAAYTNMFNTHRLYQVCGVYQTAWKDIYRSYILPVLPEYAAAQSEAKQEIDDYFASRPDREENEMTGIFAGKNVILVLMESMDDFALGEYTPTINRLMEEGINFTNFYTPGYGGVRTFNSEFCINTGSFLSSSGGYAFDYITNDYRQSLASLLTDLDYSAKVYHYNTPDFYSRGVFSPAMGYEEYVCYEDYVMEGQEKDLYSDQFLFDYADVADSFFRDGKRLNFIITRSAHLSYKYNEVLSYWALKQYPEFRGKTGNEELDCMYLKAKLVDDMFARLLAELEARGELENTVIVAVTDHYAYGFKNVDLMLAQSGVEDTLLLEKTPCFIWSADGPDIEVEKVLNTSDLLPTVLNLMGVESPYPYIGKDAFDARYPGYALFPNGSWICDGVAYSATTGDVFFLKPGKTADPAWMEEMSALVSDFVRINNLILDTDYYKESK